MGCLLIYFLLGSPISEGLKSVHLGESFLLDTSRIIIPNPWGRQGSPFLTYSNNKYFAVWEDSRGTGARFTLFDSDGTLLDSFGIDLPVDEYFIFKEIQGVASTGGYYNVMWTEFTYNPIIPPVECRNAIIDTLGNIRFVFSNTYLNGAICSFSDKFAMVYVSTFPDYLEIEFRNTNGYLLFEKVFSPDSLNVSGFGASKISYSGQDFLIVFSHNDTIFGFRMDTLGNVLTEGALPIVTPGADPHLYFGLSRYLLITSRGPTSNKDLWGTIISPDLSYISEPFPIVTADGEQKEPSLSIAVDYYFVAWTDARGGIFAARIDTTGTVLDPNGFSLLTKGNPSHPSLAIKDPNFIMAFSSRSNVYIITIDTVGNTHDQIWKNLTFGYNYQGMPKVSTDGSNYMAVWMEMTSDWDIKGALLSPLGSIIKNFTISQGSWDEKYPDITFNGENFIVVWEDYRNGEPDIYGARITRDGIVIDTDGIPLVTGSRHELSPEIDSYCEETLQDSGNSILVFKERTQNPYHYKIKYLIVSPTGVISSAPIFIGLGNYFDVSSSIFNFFIVWNDTSDWIVGRRVTHSGEIIDQTPIHILVGNFPTVSWGLRISNPPPFYSHYYLVTGTIYAVCMCSIIYAKEVDALTGAVGELVPVAGTLEFGDMYKQATSYQVFGTEKSAILYKHKHYESGYEGIDGTIYPDISSFTAVIGKVYNPDVIAGPRSLSNLPVGGVTLVYESFVDSYGTLRVVGNIAQFTDSLPGAPLMDEEPPETQGDTNTVSWSMPSPRDLYNPAYEFYVECATDSNFDNVVSSSGWIPAILSSGSYTFTSLTTGVTYYYRVKGRNLLGEGPWSNVVWSQQVGTSHISEKETLNKIKLSLRSTNPTRSNLTLSIFTPFEIDSKINIYDCTGRLVKRLFMGKMGKGTHILIWKGEDIDGHLVGDGVYFIKFKIGEREGIKKVVFLR
jgi:hypothetical protein